MSNVIHHDFGRKAEPLLGITSDVLYADDHVALLRTKVKVGDEVVTTHHLAYKLGAPIALIPVAE